MACHSTNMPDAESGIFRFKTCQNRGSPIGFVSAQFVLSGDKRSDAISRCVAMFSYDSAMRNSTPRVSMIKRERRDAQFAGPLSSVILNACIGL